jgi:hypothetical protein
MARVLGFCENFPPPELLRPGAPQGGNHVEKEEDPQNEKGDGDIAHDTTNELTE